ncbi:hypothetical protein [Streptomyces sp. NPDC001388]|uniref:hypothetical protein n=1 Tax=Streptomyces sp. NPDC001388 TaxID=3364568 RepID=UPI003693806B
MHTTRTRPSHGVLTAGAAALALLAAGCSQPTTGARTDGCRADGHWSEREQAAWLRTAVAFRGTADGADPAYEHASVVVRAQHPGDAGPLCRPLAVQVEFWSLTATTTGTRMSSVMRHRLDTDGSGTHSVRFPTGLPTGRDGVCAGVLVAAYAGAPLTGEELPGQIPDLAAAGDADVRFGTERVGAYRLFPPPDPAGCATDRRTVGPSPTGSAPSPSPSGSTAWDVFHP